MVNDDKRFDKGSASERRRSRSQNGDDRRSGISFTAMIFFVLWLAAAATLFIAAGIMWLAEAIDSVPLACVIAGGAAALVSLIIYLASVRRSTAIMRDYIETVYETSRIAKTGYERIKSWIEWIELLFD